MMVSYQEDLVFTADGVAGPVNQIFLTVAPDFLQYNSFAERFLSHFCSHIFIYFCADEKKGLPLFLDILGQYDVVLSKSALAKIRNV